MTDDEIIAAIGFDGAAAGVKASMVDNIRSVAEMRLMRLVDGLMSRKQRKEFDRLVAAGDNDAVWRWIERSVLGAAIDEAREAAIHDYIEEFNRRQRETLGRLGVG